MEDIAAPSASRLVRIVGIVIIALAMVLSAASVVMGEQPNPGVATAAVDAVPVATVPPIVADPSAEVPDGLDASDGVIITLPAVEVPKSSQRGALTTGELEPCPPNLQFNRSIFPNGPPWCVFIPFYDTPADEAPVVDPSADTP